ncbi:MAG: signal peptidase I [Thermoanaerobaculales bacterium]|jgi:signal peptidase I|nr:signal peptidase I [Thermoanaerobaculales bacterium]
MKKTVFREYYEAILVAFILALFVRTFVFENFKIPSRSMEDGLLVGDHLVVNKFLFSEHFDSPLHALLPYQEPERGDVVVFKYPVEPRRDFIKRCVAVAGDTVEVRDKELFVNGELQNEPYVVHKSDAIIPNQPSVRPSVRPRDNFGPFLVPPGTIFCMGDNRDNSSDSRFWGPVPVENIKGRALLIYWSFDSAPSDGEWHSFGHRFTQLADVFVNFFTKTRWERQFRLIR